MVYYIEGDAELQEMILEYWVKRGLNDPFGYFVKAIEHLQQEHPPGPGAGGGRGRKEVQQPTLGQLCREWMEEWAERYLVNKAPQLLKSLSPTKYVISVDNAENTTLCILFYESVQQPARIYFSSFS